VLGIKLVALQNLTVVRDPQRSLFRALLFIQTHHSLRHRQNADGVFNWHSETKKLFIRSALDKFFEALSFLGEQTAWHLNFLRLKCYPQRLGILLELPLEQFHISLRSHKKFEIKHKDEQQKRRVIDQRN
jgi:hypothetical protein